MTLSYEEIRSEVQNGNPRMRDPYHGAKVTFIAITEPDPAATLKEGRAQTKTTPTILIERPGCDSTGRAITQEDKERFPKLWAAYLASEGGEAVSHSSGLALSQWAGVTRDQVKELVAMGFSTVEQLAEANSAVQKKMGPLAQNVKRAKEYLAAAGSDQSKVAALTERLEVLEKKYASQLEQNELLIQRIEASEGTSFKK